MDENEVTVLYSYAAALMPNEGKWNKPTTASEILAHAHALRNVPFEVGCYAANIVIMREGTWPAPWHVVRVSKELSSDLSIEKARWGYGPELEESMASVLEVAQHEFADNAAVQELLTSHRAERELSS